MTCSGHSQLTRTRVTVTEVAYLTTSLHTYSIFLLLIIALQQHTYTTGEQLKPPTLPLQPPKRRPAQFNSASLAYYHGQSSRLSFHQRKKYLPKTLLLLQPKRTLLYLPSHPLHLHHLLNQVHRYYPLFQLPHSTKRISLRSISSNSPNRKNYPSRFPPLNLSYQKTQNRRSHLFIPTQWLLPKTTPIIWVRTSRN
jgi:hypothetical protein